MSHDQYASYASLDDAALLSKIIAGDEQAIVYLLTVKCGPALKHLCYKYASAGLQYHDLVGEMFVKLQANNWAVLKAFLGANAQGDRCKLSSYIITIAARFMHKSSAKQIKEINWVDALDHEEMALEGENAQYEQIEIAMDILDALMQLKSPQERLVIMEYKLNGRSVEEVASLLGQETGEKSNHGRVYTICSRAMKNLKSILQEGGNYV